jgi:hypothetical protein
MHLDILCSLDVLEMRPYDVQRRPHVLIFLPALCARQIIEIGAGQFMLQ